MQVNVELDLTPENAESLKAFEQLFHSGLFYLLAKRHGLGQTDLHTLYRTMGKVVRTAGAYRLCEPGEERPVLELVAATVYASEELLGYISKQHGRLLGWYAAQSVAVQKEVHSLMEHAQVWLSGDSDRHSGEVKATGTDIGRWCQALAAEFTARQKGKTEK